MNYQSFRSKLKSEVLTYMPPALQEIGTIVEKKVDKVNGPKTAIIFDIGDKGASPILYMEDMYQIYDMTKDADAVIEYAAEVFMKGVISGNVMQSYMTDELKEDHIILTLINTIRNEELLKHVPHRSFLDLSVIYRYYVPLPDQTFNLVTITNEEMEEKGLCEEELFRMALENSERLLPANVEELEDIGTVVTNHHGLVGSAVLLYPALLQEIACRAGCDIYVIPSSIHEAIVIPEPRIRAEILQQMIREANETVLRPEDILSDSLYCYRLSSGQLEVVASCECVS